jgi:hypothetical protein
LLPGLCLSDAAFSRAGDRLTGYGDFRFGMSSAEIEALTGEAPAPQEDGFEAIETSEVIAGMAATRRLVLADGRLVSVVFQWTLDEVQGTGMAACQGLFTRLLGQISGRYGAPVLGPGQGPPVEPVAPGAPFAGASFWSFFDGASIALIVRSADSSGTPCRATVNYKEAPPDSL